MHQAEADYDEVDNAVPPPIDKSVPPSPIRPDHNAEGRLISSDGEAAEQHLPRPVSVMSEDPYGGIDEHHEPDELNHEQPAPADDMQHSVFPTELASAGSEPANNSITLSMTDESSPIAFPSQALPQPQMFLVAASPERKQRSSSLQTAHAVSAVPLVALRTTSAIPKPVVTESTIQSRLRCALTWHINSCLAEDVSQARN